MQQIRCEKCGRLLCKINEGLAHVKCRTSNTGHTEIFILDGKFNIKCGAVLRDATGKRSICKHITEVE